MLLLFIRTIWSTYVPISKTANPAISFISKSDIDSLGEIYKNLFVFAIKSSEKNKDYLISLITKMQILFEGSAKFALFDSNYIEKLEDKEKLKKNTMFYFANGYKFGAYSFSIYETETLFLIDSIVNENTKKEEESNTQKEPKKNTTRTTKKNLEITKNLTDKIKKKDCVKKNSLDLFIVREKVKH